MCDYSLKTVQSRPAVVGDKLVTRDFGTGTRGFCSPDDTKTAVCVLPGTELAFDKPVKVYGGPDGREFGPTARFRQVNKDNPHCHHDCLEFANGSQILLTFLAPDQTATVLQTPADPSKLEHRRVAYT